MEVGQEAFLAIHVRRDRFTAPVLLAFDGLPPNVQVGPEGRVAGDEDCWKGSLKVGRAAMPGSSLVRVTARPATGKRKPRFS